MSFIYTFLIDNWLMVLIAFIVISAVVSLVKTIIRWVVTLVVVGAVILYALNYTPEEIQNIGTDVAKGSAEVVKDTAINILISGSTDEVEYVVDAEGKYTISRGSVSLQGDLNTGKAVIITDKGSLNVNVDGVLQDFVGEVTAGR